MTQPEPTPPAPSAESGESEPEAKAEIAAQVAAVSIDLFARTDVGQVREHNEDNFLVADLTQRSRGLLEANRKCTVSGHGSLFAVCDGMGGAAAGEVASQLAVDILYEKMVEGVPADRVIERNELARRLVRSVENAGLRIFQEAKADRTRRGMGTTVTAAALVDEILFLAQVGDSRGYILREGQLVQVTRDQSLVNQLIEAGQLTEEEAETFEHNNIILQALGTADTVQVDLTFVDLRKGDTLLLCSDGLSGMVRFDEIRDTLLQFTEPLEACKALTEKANQAGGHDNITVVVVKFDGTALKDPADAEPLKYRKYPLPEEISEQTSPTRRIPSLSPAAPASSSSPPSGASHSVAPPAGAAGWQEPSASGAPQQFEFDEPIDIPGTHVPTWTVILLIVGVVSALSATAFLFLR